MMIKEIVASVVALTIVVGHACASPMSLRMFGHSVEIKQASDGQERLVVDKKLLLKDQYISLKELALVDGVATLIGERSAGGNACSGSIFILSFPINAAVRIDGPLDACSPGDTKIEEGMITVLAAPTPQAPGSLWTWTPASGFSVEKKVEFAANQGDGWTALRSRSIDHPSALLTYADLRRLVDDEIGSAKSSLVSAASGPGSVEYRDNILVARSCRAHSCDDTDLLIVMDISSKRAFVALKDGTPPPLIAPNGRDWPSSARSELLAFRRKWAR